MTIDFAAIESAQRTVCLEHSATYLASPGELKSGFALQTKMSVPINGLRHPPENGTTGWYIWCGEQYSEARDFFSPLHTHHLYEDHPEVAPFLGLPPGYRFLLAGNYADVWFDVSLLNV